MLAGRAVWGIAQIIFTGIAGSTFTWQMFTAAAFFKAIPGIILQLIRQDEASDGAVFPAADQSAQKYRNVHRQQHVANLWDLSGKDLSSSLSCCPPLCSPSAVPD